MNRHWRMILIAVSLVTGLVVGASTASADGREGHRSSHSYDRGHGYDRGRGYDRGHGDRAGRHYRRSHDYGYRYRRGYSPYAWGYAPRYGWPGYYSPRYGYGYGSGFSLGLGYGWSSGWNDSWSVGLSIPLYATPRYEPLPVYVPAPHAHRPQAQHMNQATYASSPTIACRQKREYQTEVVIGGERVPAYGTACLQADGSWKPITGPIVADY